jgi:hypothetical protein
MDALHRPVALPWTATDIDVGVRLAAILFAHAAAGGAAPITIADLLALARKAHPRDALVARAVAIGMAAKLAFVAAFCREHGLPDLASLVIDPVTGRADRASALAGHDWQGAAPALPGQLAAYAKRAHAAVPARFKVRAERPADVAWYAYFRTHRDACVALSAEGKKEIINLLMAGLDPETALARVLAAQQSPAVQTGE